MSDWINPSYAGTLAAFRQAQARTPASTCTPCRGTGKTTTEAECRPCAGTGKQKPVRMFLTS